MSVSLVVQENGREEIWVMALSPAENHAGPQVTWADFAEALTLRYGERSVWT